MGLKVVLRSYGGDNDKGRPEFYSKDLVVASFVRAARAASEVEDIEVFFVNDGPIPRLRLNFMERCGRVLQIPDGPVGMRDSYRYGLDMPQKYGWSDDDIVAYVEDDYLLVEHAFTTLIEGARALPEASYFALTGSRPTDYDDPAQQRLHGLPRGWRPLPDRVVGDDTWIHVLSVASTFAARVGPLRADRDIFEQCMRPFRNRYLDHETCLLYQGVVPYRGTEFFFGLPGDFVPGVRGVLRAGALVPYRVLLNRRARRQRTPHLLYAVQPSVATHLEVAMMNPARDWEAEAEAVTDWARLQGYEVTPLSEQQRSHA